jgi:oligopeptide/dipeptide ABC transporter ATP-binding protein
MNAFNPVVKIGHQVAEPLLLDGVDKDEAYRRATHLLEMVGLPGDVFHRYPHQLSGGMKQRAVIAMSLILKPRLILVDEPTSALDVSVQAQIMNLLKRIKGKMDLSLVFITHDIALSTDVCDRHAVMYAGQLVEMGSAEQVIGGPCHPYTQLLLASTPRLHGKVKPTFIPGAPPELVKPPMGCRFHPRCPRAFDSCRREEPSIYPVPGQGLGHWVRCFLYGE